MVKVLVEGNYWVCVNVLEDCGDYYVVEVGLIEIDDGNFSELEVLMCVVIE